MKKKSDFAQKFHFDPGYLKNTDGTGNHLAILHVQLNEGMDLTFYLTAGELYWLKEECAKMKDYLDSAEGT